MLDKKYAYVCAADGTYSWVCAEEKEFAKLLLVSSYIPDTNNEKTQYSNIIITCVSWHYLCPESYVVADIMTSKNSSESQKVLHISQWRFLYNIGPTKIQIVNGKFLVSICIFLSFSHSQIFKLYKFVSFAHFVSFFHSSALYRSEVWTNCSKGHLNVKSFMEAT